MWGAAGPGCEPQPSQALAQGQSLYCTPSSGFFLQSFPCPVWSSPCLLQEVFPAPTSPQTPVQPCLKAVSFPCFSYLNKQTPFDYFSGFDLRSLLLASPEVGQLWDGFTWWFHNGIMHPGSSLCWPCHPHRPALSLWPQVGDTLLGVTRDPPLSIWKVLFYSK